MTPGIHAMSNAEYHATTDWLSSTQLKRLLPHFTEPDNQEALDFGSIFHEAVLGEGDGYVVIDADDWRTKAAREERGEANKAGKPAILRCDVPRMDAMVEAVHNHHDAAALLFSNEGTSEESAFWVDDAGVQHKARFDRRIPGAIIDLKSTSAKRLTADELAKVTADYGYDLSAVHYLAVAQGLGLDADAFAWVFVSKHPPHHVVVAEPDTAFLEQGRILRDMALDRAVNGQRGYTTLTPPRWRDLGIEPTTTIPADFEWSLHDYA